MALHEIDPKKLDDFIKKNLEPSGFNVEVREAMNRICEFLRNQCFTKQTDVKVIKAVKGGSSGKGTALKNSSDADLVVFLSCFKSFQHQRDTRHEILEGIQAMLDKYSQSLAYQVDNININIIKQSTTSPKSLSFELQSKKSSETVSFDVLPTYDALTPLHNTSKAHLELIQFANNNEMTDGEFSACFTELQRSFVKQQFPKVKDLIRLLKYWYKEYVKPRKSELRNGARLPAKYALELLTIYAWEESNHQERFDMAEGFRTVLELICRYQDLCIYWTNYYDVNNAVLADFIIKKLHNRRPIILDPADPTGNVASSDGWNVMKDEARKWLSMPCVSNVEAWDVQPVKTFQVTVTTLNGNSLQQNASIYNKVSEIKRGIQERWNIPAFKQRLLFKDTILDDRITLLDAKIFFDAEIQLLTLSVMEIFVGIDGRNLTIQVLPSDKVSSLKAEIESLERIRRSQYYLTFQSTPLEDERTLQSYGIKQYSTILVNLRVRGGSEIQLSNAEDPKRVVSQFLRRWLGLPRNISSIAPYRNNCKPRLPLKSIEEEFKHVFMLELTVPLEERMEEAYEQKRAKYEDLKNNCQRRGWRAKFWPMESRSIMLLPRDARVMGNPKFPGMPEAELLLLDVLEVHQEESGLPAGVLVRPELQKLSVVQSKTVLTGGVKRDYCNLFLWFFLLLVLMTNLSSFFTAKGGKTTVLRKNIRSATMELYHTEPRRLDDFIKRNLEPVGFNAEVKQAVHRICEFLKDRCFKSQPSIKVVRAVKGGSSGKGTAVKQNSDADLVVFLSCFKSFQDQRDTRLEVLEGIQQILEECSRSIAYEIRDITITSTKQSSIPPKSLSFELKSKKSSESVSFDVLPTYDALKGQYNANEAHCELIRFLSKNRSTDGEFSPCFTELQRAFVKKYTSKVKDLIRLLKYWYILYVKPRKSELRAGARLPPKYALELLTIHAWEQGNRKESFDTAEGFRTVLELICRYRELCIYWTDYYDVTNGSLAEFLNNKLRDRRPIILDPANPTGNVASSDGWDVMENEARKCLIMPCVSSVRAWNVQPVKTFRVTVTTLNCNPLQQNASIYNKVSEIKRGIQEKWNIPALQQCLLFKDTILEDRITLLDAKIFFDAEIQLVTLSVIVRINGRNLTIQVLPNDKVSSLKDKIESLERIRRSQYYLTFQSMPLEDERTLQSYGIKQNSTILVNLRLRGGSEIQPSNAEDPTPHPLHLWGRDKTAVLRKNIRSATMELYYTEPRRLDDFIKRNLEPVGFNAEVKQAVQRICVFLKNRCFMSQPNIKVVRAVKGGSSGKGTAVKQNSDADLVVFLSCFKSFQDQRDTRLEILEGIQQILEECSRSIAYEIRDITITSTKQSSIPPKSLSFELKSKKSSESVSFDVLPTYDALKGQYNANEAHCELIRFLSKNRSTDGEFSPCFTELQRAFVKKYTSKVKDLIRLLKYWYILYVKPRKSELRAGARLPPKYALELLTIHAWEQGNRKESFDTAEGFRTVLELICRYRELCIYWTDYYDVTNGSLAEFLNNKLRDRRPIILDPANPTGNVASSDGWDVMENEARKCLRIPCVSSVRAWNVQPVKTFRVTVTTLNCNPLQQNASIYNKVSEIKRGIQEKWNIPALQQCLLFKDTILEDRITLLDAKIFFDAEIQLVTLSVIVRINGRNLTIQVLPSDKVSSLKDKIESLERIRRSQYYLTFQSMPLEDERTLQSYGIKQNSTILVNLRLRGGSEIQPSNAEDPN
ncbi:2'-5'-oligoadenylate synthase 3-like [Mobula birostris]|uniref:2'-5'-oligoadenylate synthase 3-like n=1 Tax=Mobula birostris TaxID=1983395 RepID=UPI003B27D7DA